MSAIIDLPGVDVILPFHEVNAYLYEAIESICQSVGVKVNLILIDDRLELIEEFKQPLGATLIKSGGVGYAKSILLATQTLKSEYVAFMDSDDLTSPRRLRDQIGLLKISDSDLCSCDMLKIDSRSRVNRLQSVDLSALSKQSYELLLGSFGANSTWVIKNSFLRSFDFFQKDVESLDWATALKSFGDVKRIHLHKKYYFYRQHRGQMTKSSKYIDSIALEVYPLWRNLNATLKLPILTKSSFTSVCFPNAQTQLNEEVFEWIRQFQNQVSSISIKKRVYTKAVISYRIATTIWRTKSLKNLSYRIRMSILVGNLIYICLVLRQVPVFRIKIN
jgi:glycosyltransferase involved in cell wall biosynthesis